VEYCSAANIKSFLLYRYVGTHDSVILRIIFVAKALLKMSYTKKSSKLLSRLAWYQLLYVLSKTGLVSARYTLEHTKNTYIQTNLDARIKRKPNPIIVHHMYSV